MTSTLYVALISPALLETWQVYFPLCSGFRFFRLRVHFFFFPSSPAPPSSSASGRLSFSQTMSGRGLPLAVHFRRTELPTGRAMTRFLIFDGCVKRGRTARKEEFETVIRNTSILENKFCFYCLLMESAIEARRGHKKLLAEMKGLQNSFIFTSSVLFFRGKTKIGEFILYETFMRHKERSKLI